MMTDQKQHAEEAVITKFACDKQMDAKWMTQLL